MNSLPRILVPSYAEEVRCIGEACEDSCCIGWDIDVDKQTWKKYRKEKDRELKDLYSSYIYKNPLSFSKEVDYRRISIQDSRWCPFLTDQKLCLIQQKKGEDHLSNVCFSFPRNYNLLNGVYELSLYLSCPEAVRKLISREEPIQFREKELTVSRFIISRSIDCSHKKWKNSPIRHLPELREQSIAIIQNRSIELRERILQLGELADQISQKDRETDIEEQSLDFLIYAIESLGIAGSEDSREFSRLTDLVLGQFSQSSKAYEKAFNSYIKPFQEQNPHIFEHYLVNTMFQEHFPFSLTDDPFDSYVLLVLRYTMILLYLSALASHQGTLKLEDVAAMIQIHTKIINHHKSFSHNILQEITRKGLDNMNFISGWLR